MTALLARDEEESREPDITLSTASLLALFLGFVLVCGVFFGFGYSVGRRSTIGAGTSTATANTADVSEKSPAVETQEAANDTSSTVPTDLSTADETPSPVGNQGSGHGGTETAAPERVIEPLHAAQPAAVTLPALEKPAVPLKSDAAKSDTPKKMLEQTNAIRPTGRSAMVQVAAVVREEDADVLVSALRKRGYSAIVRTEAQDKLLHVQVGPFGDRLEANAMRQKLLSDGYAAIIKQ